MISSCRINLSRRADLTGFCVLIAHFEAGASTACLHSGYHGDCIRGGAVVGGVNGAVLLGVAGPGLWDRYSLGGSQRTLPGTEQLDWDVGGMGSGRSREDRRRLTRGQL